MKAIRIHEFGGPEVLRVEDLPTPHPGPGEVLIKVQASSVNPVDYKMRNGGYVPASQLPLTLGRDVAGTVEIRAPPSFSTVQERSWVSPPMGSNTRSTSWATSSKRWAW